MKSPIPSRELRASPNGPARVDGRPLTAEQAQALASGARLLKIQAFAGTGKTTLLRAFAQQSTLAKGLYLAFNTGIARHARGLFPSNVECKTHNSAALGALRFRDPAWRDIADGKLDDVGKEHLATLPHADGQNLDMALKTLSNFMQSGATEIDEGHFPLEDALFLGNGDVEADPLACVALARRAWEAMRDASSPFPIPHDGYLKLWSLDPGQLPFDFIMVDESQDSNPAFLQGMASQKARQIFVGDEHQGIYAFRGAVNALRSLSGFEERALTATHRFGPRLAMLANALIAAKRAPLRLSSAPGAADTAVVFGPAPLGASPLHLARSNAGLFGKAIALASQGRSFHVVGGAKFTFADLADLMALGGGNRDVGAYRAYADLESLAENAAAAGKNELALRARLAKKHGGELPRMLEAIHRKSIPPGDESQPDAPRLSTLHQAKGLESDWVELLGDFPASGCVQSPPLASSASDIEEANILYVAITRAKRGLALPAGPIQDWAKGALESFKPDVEPEIELF